MKIHSRQRSTSNGKNEKIVMLHMSDKRKENSTRISEHRRDINKKTGKHVL